MSSSSFIIWSVEIVADGPPILLSYLPAEEKEKG